MLCNPSQDKIVLCTPSHGNHNHNNKPHTTPQPPTRPNHKHKTSVHCPLSRLQTPVNVTASSVPPPWVPPWVPHQVTAPQDVTTHCCCTPHPTLPITPHNPQRHKAHNAHSTANCGCGMDGEEQKGVSSGPSPSSVVVTIWLDATEEAAFDAASNTETLPRLFTGSGLVPGVESAHMEDGEGGIGVGRVRVVTTSDGKTVRETYTEVDRPSRYAYEMTELNMPLAAIMTHAVGEWDFVAEAGGTRVTWTYYAFPRNVLARPATALLTKGFLKSAMNGYLANLKTQLELELPPVWEPDTSAPGCSLCKTEFSFFTRRHHCRACGALVCAECSPSKTPLPHFGINKPVRVCRECNPDTPDPLSAASASIADDDL